MIAEKLKKQDVFELLRPEQVNLLSETAEVVRFKAGEMVYSQGTRADRFYIVLKGQVSLRLPGEKTGVSVLIDELTKGEMFGCCVCTALDAYLLNAQCTADSELLVLSISALKGIMDDDLRIGYAIQSGISGPARIERLYGHIGKDASGGGSQFSPRKKLWESNSTGCQCQNSPRNAALEDRNPLWRNGFNVRWPCRASPQSTSEGTSTLWRSYRPS